jgi:hypothetical protein
MYEYARIFVNKLFMLCILGIVYNAIMHKQGFGHAYYIDLLKRFPTTKNGIFLRFLPD